jgi:hypothetical protein
VENNLYENKALCKECGGECCRSMGCHFSPLDFEFLKEYDKIEEFSERYLIIRDYLRDEIEKRHISIDWWGGDPEDENFEESKGFHLQYTTDIPYYCRTYFLRMRHKGANIVDPSYGGTCSIWDEENGCPIEFKKRPMGARMLIPNKDGCVTQYTNQQCAIDWEKYNDVLWYLVGFFVENEGE